MVWVLTLANFYLLQNIDLTWVTLGSIQFSIQKCIAFHLVSSSQTFYVNTGSFHIHDNMEIFWVYSILLSSITRTLRSDRIDHLVNQLMWARLPFYITQLLTDMTNSEKPWCELERILPQTFSLSFTTVSKLYSYYGHCDL